MPENRIVASKASLMLATSRPAASAPNVSTMNRRAAPIRVETVTLALARPWVFRLSSRFSRISEARSGYRSRSLPVSRAAPRAVAFLS
jgi:hypothetical protein